MSMSHNVKIPAKIIQFVSRRVCSFGLNKLPSINNSILYEISGSKRNSLKKLQLKSIEYVNAPFDLQMQDEFQMRDDHGFGP